MNTEEWHNVSLYAVFRIYTRSHCKYDMYMHVYLCIHVQYRFTLQVCLYYKVCTNKILLKTIGRIYFCMCG